MLFFLCLIVSTSCLGQETSTKQDGGAYLTFPYAVESFRNVSVELVYHTGVFQTGNFIISPFNVWSALAAVTDGAQLLTRKELYTALRISRNRTLTRSTIQGMMQNLNLNTATIQLARFNAILIDKSQDLEHDFQAFSKIYGTFTIPANLTNAKVTASKANKAVTAATKGLITRIADEIDFGEPQMIVMSAAYFSGQWTSAFNVSSTSKRPFYDSNGVQTGEVNMMYNRFTYPLADIDALKASVIELPYDSEGRLSLVIMLPQKGFSLKDMFMSLKKVALDAVFSALRLDQQEHGEDRIDCFIPRFRIDSKLEMKQVLKRMGIHRMFNESAAAFGRLARSNVHVTKVIHKTVIEVSEGIPEARTPPDFKQPAAIATFEANRPFTYIVLEKTTNIVLFEGFYQEPHLY